MRTRIRYKARRHNEFRRAFVDDVIDHGIDPAVREELLELFKYAMRGISTQYACEARFDFAEIDSAKGTPCARYSLYLTRYPMKGTDMVFWTGVIHHRNGRNKTTNDAERMEVFGHIED